MARVYFSGIVIPVLILSLALSLCGLNAQAWTIDRVIAYIDETAITQRELDAAHARAISADPSRTKAQTLEALINTTLILIEARKLRLKDHDNSSLVQSYLELKVRALVFVREAEVRAYYEDNRDDLADASYGVASPEIRKYLTEAMYNMKLREHIQALRAGAHIRILEAPEDREQ